VTHHRLVLPPLVRRGKEKTKLPSPLPKIGDLRGGRGKFLGGVGLSSSAAKGV